MPFFEYNQNNSFGRWDYDGDAGISQVVIIEADSPAEADEKAMRIGLYFDGAGDCPCCGPRWYSKEWSFDTGDPVPSVYGTPIPEATLYGWIGTRANNGLPDGFIHYADGHMEAVWVDMDDPGDLMGRHPLRITPWPFIEGEVVEDKPLDSAGLRELISKEMGH